VQPSQEEEDFAVENLANQVIIESSFASSSQVGMPFNRMDFVKKQKKNRYSPKNSP